ncbi:hypothetical protein SBI_04128 [Streptomyces bingchenggensis BCW-1]|uniref:Uncharacterized protein n=1 Tax=Streptomyces bingchenggensis (strain BCW-1) TaxID=749414 RepID=D7BRR2_STRBB|nr:MULTISPECIES: hypothetical protein [Streptomyces]ADI07249.1 hypothetical protein SBI_04128 [Streptomyces bingchenggensis BCW-1]
MSDWTWEYLPDAENVVGGLDPQIKHDVERLAQRLADAAPSSTSVTHRSMNPGRRDYSTTRRAD